MPYEFLRSKFFILVAVFALLMVSILLGNQLYRRYQTNQEIAGLENEIAKLESSNQDILKLINYFKTPEFRERQARSLLNLQKPGEFAVALPVNEEEKDTSSGVKADPKSNFIKWWEYFFGK